MGILDSGVTVGLLACVIVAVVFCLARWLGCLKGRHRWRSFAQEHGADIPERFIPEEDSDDLRREELLREYTRLRCRRCRATMDYDQERAR